MKRWYVVNTQPREERRAAEHLRRQGFDPWLPLYRRHVRHARRVESVLSPLFPGYIFVSIDLECDRWRSINGTSGVVRIVCSGDQPVAVPGTVIDEILDRRDETGAVVVAPPTFVPGQRITVADGPLADIDGLFQGMAGADRVTILFDLLGRQVKTTLPLAKLAA